MNPENRQWQETKENYLKQIEKSLAQVGHPHHAEILANVREHLDNKYAELLPDQQNREGYQQIITEMGPPEEYAELLTENKVPQAKKTPGINLFLAIVFVIVLAAVGSYLIYTSQKTPGKTLTPGAKSYEFEPDQRVLGKWISIDFVKMIEDFDPSKKSCQMELFLEGLDLQDKGVIWWLSKGKKYKHHWTKGKVNPLSERPAFYYLRNINGAEYLFFEWISGDVTLRGREPSYYVLKRTSGDKPIVPDWFENDPEAIGYWQAVDFVETIEDFQPEQWKTEELFIKTLLFKDNSKLYWTVSHSKPMPLDWTKGKIRPFDVWPTVYLIKQLQENNYLFYKHRTQDSETAGYFVFKQMPQPETVEQSEDEPFQNDPQVLGQWITVDFVHTINQFKPDHPSWTGKLYLQSLDIKQQGNVEFCCGEDQMKINHRWTKGQLNPDDDLPSRYTVTSYNDQDYLFMEWNSGDVTIRGQKPAYYVLKKEE